MLAGTEGVAELSKVNELARLRLADDELRAPFYLFILIRIAPRNGIPRIILPLDDLEKLCFQIIH
jgi:hypothetical protein